MKTIVTRFPEQNRNCDNYTLILIPVQSKKDQIVK
jgi:hypothetical protein